MTGDGFSDLPKVELHTHIDCGLSFSAIGQLSPGTSLEEYRHKFQAPKRCGSLKQFLSSVDASLNVMQTRAALTLAAADLADQLVGDNVLYAEVRFSPLLHCRNGLSPEAAVEAVLQGLRTVDIPIGLILCTLRHFDTRQGLLTLDLVRRYQNDGAVGIDLAADEENFPITPHIPVFQKARDQGISRTAHAGEARGSDSVAETIRQLSPTRLGHGVRCIEDAGIVSLVIESGVHMEVCPSVNIQVGVFEAIEDHPVDILRARGVSLGINTDARGTSAVSLNHEYSLLADTFGWDEAVFLQANLDAINASFATDAIKESVRKKLQAQHPSR